MRQSLEVKARVGPLRRELLPAALPGARGWSAPPSDEVGARAPARGVDVFRLVVALSGIAAFLALPAGLIAGVVFLLSR
jgi:hypothetical protein